MADGPLQNALTLQASTDSAGNLNVIHGTYASPDSPAMNLANTRLRMDANGNLLVSFK